MALAPIPAIGFPDQIFVLVLAHDFAIPTFRAFLPKPGLSLVVSGCRVNFWIRHLDRDEPGSKPLRWSVGHGAAQRYRKSRSFCLTAGRGAWMPPNPSRRR